MNPSRCRTTTLHTTALLALGVLGTASAIAEPPAQIAVSPSRFEVAVGNRPTTESVNLMNLSDRDVTIRVTTAHWDLDETSQLRLLEPTEQSLDQWMVINPTRFTVPAGETQTVRFSIRPRVKPEPGEHRAMIYFNQVLPETQDRSVLRVRFSVGVAVYAMVGDPVRTGQLHAVSILAESNPAVARFDISSEGAAHVRLQGHYTVYPLADYPGSAATDSAGLDEAVRTGELPDHALLVGYLPSRPVLPDTRREIYMRLARELPPGDYVLDINGALADSPVDLAVPFSLPDPALVAGGPAAEPAAVE